MRLSHKQNAHPFTIVYHALRRTHPTLIGMCTSRRGHHSRMWGNRWLVDRRQHDESIATMLSVYTG